MSRQQQSLSSLCMLGVVVTLVGVLLCAGAGPTASASLLGTGIMIAGFVCTLTGILRVPEGSPLCAVDQAREAGVVPGDVAGSETSMQVDGESVGEALAHMADCFLTWLDRRDSGADLWTDFDRWIRDGLNQVLGARRTRCYRLTDTERRLVSLTDRMEETVLLGTPVPGLIQHVIGTGQRYLRGSTGKGDLVEQLAKEWSELIAARSPSGTACSVPDWLLPVREGRTTIGLVFVGELPEHARATPALLGAVGNFVEICWRHVEQYEALAIARRTDRASGVLNRLDLTALAETILADAQREGEPTVIMTLSVEGARRLDDEGQWELRDWIMQQVGVEMRRKLRTDDLIGRFSDDRFVVVLRRLDLALGQLIAGKALDAVKSRLATESRAAAAITVRCGLADASSATFERALGCAFDALQQARISKQELLAFSSGGTAGAEAHG